MKIIKIPITEQNREVYWSRNKDKKAWKKWYVCGNGVFAYIRTRMRRII